MKKWLKRGVLLNIIFLLIFLYFDYFTWMLFPIDLDCINCNEGTVEVFTESTYNVLVHTFKVRALHSWGIFGEWFSESSVTPNFPLAVFIMAIMVNIYLVWKLESALACP